MTLQLDIRRRLSPDAAPMLLQEVAAEFLALAGSVSWLFASYVHALDPA